MDAIERLVFTAAAAVIVDAASLFPNYHRQILNVIREHGSVSLCRDGQKTKWRLQCKY